MHYLKAFEQNDLSKYFRRYFVEEFVQRNLRRAGFHTVGDILAYDETQFQVTLSGQNQKVQERTLALYKALQREKHRIFQHHMATNGQRPSRALIEPSSDHLHERIVSAVPSAEPGDQESPPPGFENGPNAEPLRKTHQDKADIGEIAQGPQVDTQPPPVDVPPIRLGQIFRRDRFHTDRAGGYQELAYTEEGLRRHVLIVGSTGSGKTVAARYIVEQAAISGVPSIVIDAQGDISSLVLKVSKPDARTFFDKVSSLQKPETPKEEEDLNDRIKKHLDALTKHPGQISGLYAKRCLPRIFTPGRPDLGLPLSLPPYLDVLAAYSEESSDEPQRHELDELLSDEVESLVRTILPRLKPEKLKGYVELLTRLFRYAHQQHIDLDGRAGIKEVHQLVQRAQELAPDLFKNYLSEKDRSELSKAVYGLQFCQEQKWLEGQALDIAALCKPGADNRTPINVINVQELHSPEDKKRVLRQIIAAVYKFGVQNPRHSGPPSLLLYIDEIGTGYGERSVGKPEQTTTYQVYRVLNRLVRQARKYGISVMLASQAYTDFNPDLRRQLGTKIIGKVDDRTEQFRVAQSIAEGFIAGTCDPREFVQNELPQLGPPRLLYVGVRGEAYTYGQFKCCTLDVVLHGRAVRRWREAYQQETADIIDGASSLFQSDRWAEALQKLDQIANEARFVTALDPKVTGLRGRCLVRLARVPEAEKLFEEADLESAPAGWLDLGRDLAAWYRETGQSEKYVSISKRIIELDPKMSQEIHLELSKYNLFEAGDPSAAHDSLNAIGTSDDEKVTLFVRTWRKAAVLFRSWTTAWPFVSSRWAGGETSLIERAEEPLAVAITVLPGDEKSAEEPVAYKSELARNPEILRISRILDRTAQQRAPFSSLSELSSRQSECQRHVERAREFKEAGRIREAISELEQFFSGPQIVFPKEIKQYDEDPEILKVRVADWLSGLDWRTFELEVAVLFTQMGYNAWATKATGDDGVDVRALRGDEKVVIQCKHWKRQNVNVDVVKALHATKEHEEASFAVIVTSSNLEPVAQRWAKTLGVEVIEGPKLVDLFMRYCDPGQSGRPLNNRLQEDNIAIPGHQEEFGLSDKNDEIDSKILRLVTRKEKIQNMDREKTPGLFSPVNM